MYLLYVLLTVFKGCLYRDTVPSKRKPKPICHTLSKFSSVLFFLPTLHSLYIRTVSSELKLLNYLARPVVFLLKWWKLVYLSFAPCTQFLSRPEQQVRNWMYQILRVTKSCLYVLIYKVHIFWVGHKILRNLHCRFDRY